MYEIRIASIIPIIENYDFLLKEHWEEVAKNKQLMVLKPDIEKYKLLEKSGNLFTLVAYYNDEVVGYSCNIITPHLHYSDLLCGYNDVLFVSSKYRTSPLGLKLIRQTEKELKKLGVQFMSWHAKSNTTLDKILPRLDYKVHEIMYGKEL